MLPRSSNSLTGEIHPDGAPMFSRQYQLACLSLHGNLIAAAQQRATT
jgi:hypothetical protein